MLNVTRVVGRAARTLPAISSGRRSLRRQGLATLAPLAVQELGDPSVQPPDASSPIVFIHGLLGSGTNFRSIAFHPSIRTGRRVLTVDLRNHGKSPHDDTPMTLELLAEDVAAALHAAGAVSPMVVGHSLGGKVAMTLALRHPHLVSARPLVVIDIAPVSYDTAHPQWLAVNNVVAAAAALDPATFPRRADIDRALAASVPDAGMRSFVLQNLLTDGEGKYHWRLHLPAILRSMPLMARFMPPGAEPANPVETHFIGGQRSRYILPEYHATARTLFPAARMHTIADAGHWVHADKPAEFIALLARIAAGEESSPMAMREMRT